MRFSAHKTMIVVFGILLLLTGALILLGLWKMAAAAATGAAAAGLSKPVRTIIEREALIQEARRVAAEEAATRHRQSKAMDSLDEAAEAELEQLRGRRAEIDAEIDRLDREIGW